MLSLLSIFSISRFVKPFPDQRLHVNPGVIFAIEEPQIVVKNIGEDPEKVETVTEWLVQVFCIGAGGASQFWFKDEKLAWKFFRRMQRKGLLSCF